jgi:hypothetical protein
MKMKKILFLVFTIMLSVYSAANASPISIFSSSNGWTQLGNGDDGYRISDGYVNPGYGGQAFDAEYLFYKLQNHILSIGLQTGFDVVTGHVRTGGIDYYSGDLALSFDRNNSNYEYAVDFGLFTKDYVTPNPVGGNTGTAGYDSAGVYRVTTWNNDVYSSYGASRPFAMQSGTMLGTLTENSSGTGSTPVTTLNGYSYGGSSYYRIVSFPTYLISEIIDRPINLAAHWTMSCGNDAIDGQKCGIPNPVPEPSTMFLLSSLATGLFGFAGLRRRFMK